MPAPTTKEWDGFNTENQIMSIDQATDATSFESEIVIQEQCSPKIFSKKVTKNFSKYENNFEKITKTFSEIDNIVVKISKKLFLKSQL